MKRQSNPLGVRLGSVATRYSPPGRAYQRTNFASNIGGGVRSVASPGRKRRQRRDGPNTRDESLRRLEAVLFLAREPMNSRKLSQHANLADATEARTLIRRLNEMYDRSGRAFRVEEVAGGYQMMTRGKFASWLRRLGHVPAEVRLSAPAQETLAVIAYRQPVLRADIEAIRGVNCGEILRQLMERDLVRICGRSDDLGRPYLYGTTRRFLQIFGLRHLDELPRAQQLRGSSAGSKPADTHLPDAKLAEFESATRAPLDDPPIQPRESGP